MGSTPRLARAVLSRECRACGPPAVILFLLVSTCGAQTSAADLLSQADSARKSNDLPTAVALYRASLQKDGTSRQGWWYLGNCLFALKQFPEAIEALDSLLKLDPQLAPAIALRGLSRIHTGDYRGALADISSVISKHESPDVPTQLLNVLQANQPLLLSRLGDFDRSLRVLGTFANATNDGLTPDLTDAIGIAILRRPILPTEIAPAEHDLITRAGRAGYLQLSKSPQAESSFQQLCADFPSARNVHFALGYVKLAHDPTGAANEFRRELNADPDNSDANMMLGYVLLNTGKPLAALEFARKAVKLSPDSATAQSIYGRVLLALGKSAESVSFLEKSARLDPGNLENELALVKAYLNLGRFADAKQERQAALQLKNGTGK